MPKAARAFAPSLCVGVFVLAVSGWSDLLLASTAVSSPPLSLQQTLHYAEERAPSLDSARRSQVIGELAFSSARARFLPSLDLSSQHGVQAQSPSVAGAGSWVSQLGVSLSENLYDNGESMTTYRIADLGREIAELGYRRAREQLALDIALEFYNHSLAYELFDAREESRAIVNKQFTNVSAQYRQGLRTRQDFLRFKIQSEQAESDSLTAKAAIAQSRATLSKLIGAPLDEGAPEFVRIRSTPVALEIPREPVKLTELYEFRINALQARANTLNEDFTRRKYWPQVSVSSSVVYGNSGYLGSGRAFGDTDSVSWNAVLGIQYNLWDWGTRSRDLAIAEHKGAIQNSQLLEANLTLNASIATLEIDLQRLQANYQITRELLELSQQSYEALETGYRQGKQTYLDLITGVKDLLDARVSYATSYFTLLQKIAQHRYFKGKLYESL